MEPITEFRTIAVEGDEPPDRTVAGISIGNGTILNIGEIDTTDEPQYLPVYVFWLRVVDMNGATALSNIRVWLSGAEQLTGNNTWCMDIADIWTRGKSPTQIETGSPGVAPHMEPVENLSKNGGGNIVGTTHDQTSQYIYLAGIIGIDESSGIKNNLKLIVKYDYY